VLYGRALIASWARSHRQVMTALAVSFSLGIDIRARIGLLHSASSALLQARMRSAASCWCSRCCRAVTDCAGQRRIPAYPYAAWLLISLC
jgi:hypothetical protein